MNNYLLIALLFVTPILFSCAPNTKNVKEVDSNESEISTNEGEANKKSTDESYISTFDEGILLSGEVLEKYRRKKIPAGMQHVSFDGQLRLTQRIESENTTSEENDITVGCILILPLCLINHTFDLVPKGKSTPVKRFDANCTGSLNFISKNKVAYSIKIKNAINTMPKIIVKERIPPWETFEEEMNCLPNTRLNSDQQKH